ALSTWALKKVAERVDREGRILASSDSGFHVRVSRSGKAAERNAPMSWDDVMGPKVTLPEIQRQIEDKGPVSWSLLSKFAAVSQNSDERSRRPPHLVCASAAASLIFARSSYANLYPLVNGLALYGAKVPTSAFWSLSRAGYTVSTFTVNEALATAADTCSAELKDAIGKGRAKVRIVMDNIQVATTERDFRIGSQPKMIIGCAATAIVMENCDPAAFDSKALDDQWKQNLRKTLTVDQILEDIDNNHLQLVGALHWLSALFAFVPSLKSYNTKVTEAFRTRAAIHRMPDGHRTKLYPLGTNNANEATVGGIRDAINDFLHTQLGVDPDAAEYPTIVPVSGDGLTFEQIHRLIRYNSQEQSAGHRYAHAVPILELWHTKWTDLTRVISTHYGRSTVTRDPSSLGSSASAINVPRPGNMKKVDYYPGAHTITTVLTARMVDCWSIFFGTNDIVLYFAERQASGTLPTFEEFEANAHVLVARYSSTEAYEQALESGPVSGTDMDFPVGPVWPAESGRGDGDGDGANEFTGDRVLANSILFMRDAIWFNEVCYAVAHGDIGRVLEVLKVWIFTFSGSGHHKYATYLLEMYCNFRFDFPKPLVQAILSNYLVNPSGIDGHFSEADFMQEQHNGVLEDHAQKKGSEFHEPHYRKVLSPSVRKFLEFNAEQEEALGLSKRSKTHGVPNLRDEYRALLQMYWEKDLHKFCVGRTMDHAPVDAFAAGVQKMHDGALGRFLRTST
ncbi:hypothetical protein BOTBODRAFT_93829, partial [Botryobasidium botryosum FD-172 SS1]